MTNLKIFLKVFSSPVMIASATINILFVVIFVVYGFFPAMAYWLALVAIGHLLPKSAKEKITKWHFDSVSKVMEESENAI
jgi:hypothetical protein